MTFIRDMFAFISSYHTLLYLHIIHFYIFISYTELVITDIFGAHKAFWPSRSDIVTAFAFQQVGILYHHTIWQFLQLVFSIIRHWIPSTDILIKRNSISHFSIYMSDIQADNTHVEKAQQKGETSQWKLHLLHKLNQMQWGVILVKKVF